MFPIEDEALRDRVLDEILGVSGSDNVKAWRLLSDGSYERQKPDPEGGRPAVRSQQQFIQLAREASSRGPTGPGRRDRPVATARAPAPRLMTIVSGRPEPENKVAM